MFSLKHTMIKIKVRVGRKGEVARARKLFPERPKEIAVKAISARRM